MARTVEPSLLNSGELVDSERTIISLLAARGCLTKRNLAEYGGLSWSTVVKIVRRFEGMGLIRRSGTAVREPTELGKNAYLYCLQDGFGYFVGVDVEYSRTRIIVQSLAGTILHRREFVTPSAPNLQPFVFFLIDAIEKSRAGIGGQLLGIGIGVPIWLVQDSRTADNNLFGSIEASLGERFGRTVHVHNNVRAYASYLSGQPAGAGDFALITLRTGVGFGLYMGGKVVQGENGLAGELAHMQADAHGSLCRCGGRGCVETLVGEQAILQRYSVAAGRNCASLSALASLAADGDRGALDTLRQSAEILAIPTASLVLTLDIPKIILAGPFGESGILFARMLEERIKTKLFARQKPVVLYDPLDSEGFLHGAALIAMRDFYLPLLRA